MGTVWIVIAAHDQACRFNQLVRLGTEGTVFHACRLLETTTSCFLYRRMPIAPIARVASSTSVTPARTTLPWIEEPSAVRSFYPQ
jgi:hypothetical protein